MGQEVELGPALILECSSLAKSDSSIFFIYIDDIIIIFACFSFRDFFNFYVVLTFFGIWTQTWFIARIVVEVSIVIIMLDILIAMA